MEPLILTWQARLVLLLVATQALLACSHGSGRDAIAPTADIESALRDAGLPGATLAVLRGDHIVHLQGYGVADVDTGAPMPAQARLRIASISKPLTAITVLRLAEQGRLDLDAPVLPLLNRHLGHGFVADAAYRKLSARDLLAHCGGWDRERGLDPMLHALHMARELGLDTPPRADQLVAWALARPPDFRPGSRCVYSNLGYAVLGRVIEAVTGVGYEQAVHVLVLRPAGIDAMRLAASRQAQRQPNEPRYHDARQVRSVFDPDHIVDLPDGGLHMEAMDAHGGWLATASELVQLVAALEGRSSEPLLSRASRRRMRMPAARTRNGRTGYGLGWEIDAGGRYWHGGDLPGSVALLVRERDGTVWALLGNGGVDGAAARRLQRRIAAAVRAL